MPSRDLLFLHQLTAAMWRYWFRGVIVFLLIAGGTAAATLLWPRTYQSEARIYVRLGRETVHLDPTATTGQTVSLADSREREILSVLELLRTRTLFEKVVDQMGVDRILNEPSSEGYGGSADWSHLRAEWMQKLEKYIPALAPKAPEAVAVRDSADAPEDLDLSIGAVRRRESAVRKLMQSVKSTSPKNSNVIIIQCKASSPHTAQERLERLLENYQAQHLRLHRISGSLEFFEAQAQEKKELLDEKLLELRDAKNRISVASVESQRELLSREATSITESLLQSQAAFSAAEARLNSLLASLPQGEKFLNEPESSAMSTDAIDQMRSKLFELEIEQQRLLAQFQPKHPRVRAIAEQVRLAKTLLQKQEVLVERSKLLDHQEKFEAAAEQQAEVYAKLRALNEHELQITDLDRQVAQLDTEHRKADENREQASTNEELTKNQISNINLAQPPSFAAKPVSPNPGLNLMFGLAAAAAGALTYVFQTAVRRGMSDNHADHSRSQPLPTYIPPSEPLYRPSREPVSNGV